MERKNNLRTKIILASSIIIAIFLTQIIAQGSVATNIAQRALGEVKEAASEKTAEVNHSLSLQFNILESLATYIGSDPAFNIIEQENLFTAFVTANKLCTVAYTDKDGIILGAVSADGDPPSGSVADRQYFKEAIYWKDTHAIQYMFRTAMTEDPRVLFAVPIVHKGTVEGVVFASTEQNFFEEKLWNNSESDGIDTFLIDATGTIIADMTNTGTFQNGYNIFDAFVTGDLAKVMQNAMGDSREGMFTIEGKNTSYVAYKPAGVNDWYMVSVLDYQAAMERYATNVKQIKEATWSISAVFAVCALIAFFFYETFEKKRKKTLEELAGVSRKLANFLDKSGNASFEFDARTATLHASPSLEQLLGYQLPRDWYARINERQEQYPEFDYQGVIDAYGAVMLSGGYKETVTSIRLEGKGLRWLKISMTSATDENRLAYGIVGVVADITEDYVDERLEQEEQQHIMDEALSLIPMSISANLTKDSYTMISHEEDFARELPRKGNYHDLVERMQKSVPESHRQAFIDSFSTQQLFAAFERGEKTVEIEHPLQFGKDNAVKWVLSRVSFIGSKASDDICLIILVIDNSRQKERTMLLQRSYDIAINNMPGFACKWLFDGRDVILQDANQAFFHFIKAPKERVVNHSVIYSCDMGRKNDLLSTLYEREKKHEDVHFTWQDVKFDGEEFWISVSGTYYSTQDGKSLYLCILTDITSIMRMHETLSAKTAEFQIAAELSRMLFLEYDICKKKVSVLSNSTKYKILSELDGHAPEYAIEKGIVPIIDGVSFYDTLKAIEKGNAEGEIRFVARDSEKTYWISGRYRTRFDSSGRPISAIILLSDDTESDVETTVRMLTNFYDRPDNSAKKIMVVNLTQDRIEYESELDNYYFAEEGGFIFSAAKQRFVEEGRVAEPFRAKWLNFLNNDRLMNLYRNGTHMETMVYSADTPHGSNRQVKVSFMLEESEYDGSIRAYILFTDLLAEAKEKAHSHIGNTASDTKRKVSIRAFGYFDVYINGQPIAFSHDKSKEMLAILVDRKGGFVSSSEMVSLLWENEEFNKTTQSRCRQVASRLKKTLDENGVGDIIETVNGRRRIIPEKVECDYFSYLANKLENHHLFTGTYMMNYSWSEMTIADLENSKSLF